jgi:cation transport regulator ChaC
MSSRPVRSLDEPDDGTFWIFGYGSLMWRPAFRHRERRPARLEGFARRFWQGSTDHRGEPGRPGRVVTLVRSPGAECWGTAFRVDASQQGAVLAALDHRERGGFDRIRVQVEFRNRRRASAICYVAAPGNPNHLGPAALEEMARQVRGARGPSGTNLDYVLQLAAALREIGAGDPHVFALEQLLGADPVAEGT